MDCEDTLAGRYNRAAGPAVVRELESFNVEDKRVM